jgi:hypothetical protein
MQVQIQFITYGACAALGAFSPGGIARVSPALAAHLVNEMKSAKYVEAPPAPAEKPAKTRKAKA